MDKTLKAVLAILMIMYIISPVDAMPGPIDDMLMFLIGMAARRAVNTI